YYAHSEGIEFDIVAAPGSDPGQIRLKFNTQVRLEPSGDLQFGEGDAAMTLRAPAIYQERLGGRQHINGVFVVQNDDEVLFDVPKYDRSRALIIDPVLVASTFLGPWAREYLARSVAVDKQGFMCRWWNRPAKCAIRLRREIFARCIRIAVLG